MLVFFCAVSAVSFLLLLILGLRVFQGGGGKLSILFGLYAVAAAYVSFLELMVRLSESEARAFFWGSGAFLWPLAPAIFLHFALVATVPRLRWRRGAAILGYLAAAILAAAYLHYFRSGEALVWRYGWTLTSPLGTHGPRLLFTILATGMVVVSLLLFLFRTLRPGGMLAPREQLWLFLGYAARFLIVALSPAASALLGNEIPELNSAAYAVFALLIYIGISRSYLLSLTPQRTVGSILSTMEEFLFLTTPQGNIVFANTAAQKLVGRRIEGVQGSSLSRLLGLSGDRRVPEELCYRDPTGMARYLHILSTEIPSRAGVPAGYVFLGRDVSEDRRREEALRETVHAKEAAVQELYHRVYNTLQLVISLMRLKARGGVSAETADAIIHCAGRVERIAHVHRWAHRARDFTALRFDELLRGLAQELHQASPRRESISIDVVADRAEMDIDVVIPLLLIAGELLSNSLSHAFPATRGGAIGVRYRYHGDGNFELSVTDDGVGLSQGGQSNGEGLHMVEALAEQADATVSVSGGAGTRVTVSSSPTALAESPR